MKERSLWPRLSVGMILSVGFAVSWALLLGGVVYPTIRAYSFPDDGLIQLQFTEEGMPVVTGGTPPNQCQDLDGNTLPPEQFEGVGTAGSWLVEGDDFISLPARPVEPRSALRVPWDQRIFYFNDAHAPAILWYVVTDGTPHAAAYFVGYHAKTKERVGFLGRRGFQQDPVSTDDCFKLSEPAGRPNEGLVSPWPSDLRPAFNALSFELPADGGIPPWYVYVPDVDGRCYRVNLRERTVATVPSPQPWRSGRILTRLTKMMSAFAPLRCSFAVRTDTEILLLNSAQETVARFGIPESLQEQDFFWAVTSRGESLFDVRKRLGRTENYHHDIVWCDAKGAINKSAQTTVLQCKSLSFERAVVGAMTPMPILMDYLIFWNEPTDIREAKEANTYFQALRISLQESLSQLLSCHAIALFFAYLCYRRQVRFAATKKERIVWTLFVFVMGFPGWIGYRFGRKWPVLERCASCGRSVPLDREKCAACASAFPLPALTGTEVFA
jgi:hypothetical protein